MSDSERDPRFYLLRDAMFSDWKVAQSLIDQDPGIVFARDGCGETALHYLAIENELEGVKWLVERGADINTRDDFQSTPLIAAAQLKHERMCRFLLDHGADLFAMDYLDRTAISMVCDLKPRRGSNALLEMFLIHRGDADINLFFGDLDADAVLSDQNPRIAEFWRNLGLRPRFEYPLSDSEDEEN